jgi:hypothetical protein
MWIAVLFSLGLWLSMRAAALTATEILPARCRRRTRWWQANARHFQYVSIVVALVAVGVQVGSVAG